MYRIYEPEGPKLSIKPSVHAEKHKALDTILAKKNNVPIAPPNSGPKERLIITDYVFKETYHIDSNFIEINIF